MNSEFSIIQRYAQGSWHTMCTDDGGHISYYGEAGIVNAIEWMRFVERHSLETAPRKQWRVILFRNDIEAVIIAQSKDAPPTTIRDDII